VTVLGGVAPRVLRHPAAPPAVAWAVVGLIGVIGWAALVALASRMLATQPPTAGFDLELLLEAGRRIAAGQSPYDPAIVGGAVVRAESLFYSYPPPVAQVMRLFAGLPTALVLLGWGAAATASTAAMAVFVARRCGWTGSAAVVALPTVAVLPFVFPFAIALLFGNLDAWFPAVYGLLLLAALRPSGGSARAAGLALGAATVAKLHPASLGVWFLLRGSAERRVAAVAAITVVVIVALSIAARGLDPWRDYLAVVAAGSKADLLDGRNVGPAVQLALLTGASEGLVRVFQAAVSLGAIALTAWAALRRSDPVESLALAAVVSLVTLPVTWFHYPVALIPFAVAAVVRSGAGSAATRRRTRLLIAGAVGVTVVAIGFAPLVWLAVALVLVAVGLSRPTAATRLPR
jgi:glycosyl transferase family 87